MGNVEDDKKQPGRNAYRVRFSYDGTASMESLDYSQSFCHMDVRGYPHDKQTCLYRGSYMSAHVLLNLLSELGKRDKMRGLLSILSLFRNEFNKFNNTRARMLDSIYHMTNSLKSHFWRKTL